MTDQIKGLMQRAAKVSPQYQQFTCYTQALDDNGRPKGRAYDYSQDVRGTVRWPDLDERERFYGGAVGEGMVTLVGAATPVPDLLQASDGTWLSVQSAEGEDSMGATLRLKVRRWSGDAPTIESPVP